MARPLAPSVAQPWARPVPYHPRGPRWIWGAGRVPWAGTLFLLPSIPRGPPKQIPPVLFLPAPSSLPPSCWRSSPPQLLRTFFAPPPSPRCAPGPFRPPRRRWPPPTAVLRHRPPPPISLLVPHIPTFLWAPSSHFLILRILCTSCAILALSVSDVRLAWTLGSRCLPGPVWATSVRLAKARPYAIAGFLPPRLLSPASQAIGYNSGSLACPVAVSSLAQSQS